MKAISESAFRHQPIFYKETEMANLRMGYIGKSFTTGVLGIVGTLVACGGGGVTSTVASTTTPSEHVLFAMGFSPIAYDAGNPDLKWSTGQGGKVWAGSGGTWSYGNFGIWNQSVPDYGAGAGAIDVHGAIGVNYTHSAALSSASYIYYKFTPRSTGTVDISATDKLIISMGNDKQGSNSNTHQLVTIFLEGGTLSGYDYSNSCKATQLLRSHNNVSTYSIALSDFTCDRGTMASVKPIISQVVLKVLPGGANATSDASTTANETLLKVSAIAFSKT